MERALSWIAALREFFGALAEASTWRFAWRNIGRNPRRTAIIGSAVTIGVGATILAVAFTYGMIYGMVATAVDTELGHVQIHAAGYGQKPVLERRLEDPSEVAPERLESIPGVVAVALRVRHEGLVTSPRASVGIRLVGVDPEREPRVTTIAASVTQGQFLNGERRRIVIGERLARRLHVDVGDKVVLSVQDLGGDLTGEAFRIGGLFQTASRELDESSAYLDKGEAQRWLGMGESVSEVALRIEQGGDPDRVAAAVRERMRSETEVETWEELRPMLVAMVGMFDQIGWILYGAVFVAMAFGIANVLLMSLYERIREVGIMMALGMKPGRLIASLVAESMVLTLLGVALGVGAALVGIELLSDGIDLAAWSDGLVSYGIPTKITPMLRLSDVQSPVGIALLTALGASLWPAIRAARIHPSDAIRSV